MWLKLIFFLISAYFKTGLNIFCLATDLCDLGNRAGLCWAGSIISQFCSSLTDPLASDWLHVQWSIEQHYGIEKARKCKLNKPPPPPPLLSCRTKAHLTLTQQIFIEYLHRVRHYTWHQGWGNQQESIPVFQVLIQGSRWQSFQLLFPL